MKKYLLKRKSDGSVFDRCVGKNTALWLVEFWQRIENIELTIEEDNKE